MLLHTLSIGSRFKLPLTGKTGELIRIGLSAAVVRYDGDDEDVEITDGVTGKKATFHRKGRPVQISPNTEVESL